MSVHERYTAAPRAVHMLHTAATRTLHERYTHTRLTRHPCAAADVTLSVTPAHTPLTRDAVVLPAIKANLASPMRHFRVPQIRFRNTMLSFGCATAGWSSRAA